MGLLSISICISILKNVYGVGPAIVKKTKNNMYINLVGIGVNIFLLFLFRYSLSLVGVAMVQLLSNFLTLILLWGYTENKCKIGFSKLVFILNFFSVSIITLLILFFDLNIQIRVIIVFFITVLGAAYFCTNKKIVKGYIS